MKYVIRYPVVEKDKVFYPCSRSVYIGHVLRLSSCMFEYCPFPTLTCNLCHYGT